MWVSDTANLPIYCKQGSRLQHDNAEAAAVLWKVAGIRTQISRTETDGDSPTSVRR